MELLPVHGFVLAGGKSTRMGEDKALLELGGQPLVEIAVEKLREFCAVVSIAGNRSDLAGFAPVVKETRVDAGPGAGMEAGLGASQQDWCLFVPVDVPLVPVELLRRWTQMMLGAEDEPGAEVFGPLVCSYLRVAGRPQPAFCLLKRRALPVVTRELERGNRKLEVLFAALQEEFGVASVIEADAAKFSPKHDVAVIDLEAWFANLNTPREFAEAEAWAAHLMGE